MCECNNYIATQKVREEWTSFALDRVEDNEVSVFFAKKKILMLGTGSLSYANVFNLRWRSITKADELACTLDGIHVHVNVCREVVQ